MICTEEIICSKDKDRMSLKYLSALIPAILITAIAFALALPVLAQPQPSGTLRGQVTDPSGAVVPGATVAVLTSGGPTHSSTTSKTGSYEIGNLPPGKYTVTANAQGFGVFVKNDVDVAPGQVSQFNVSLEINVQQEKVTVQSEGPTLDVNPANNASQIILRGKDLEALSDDPDELQSDLEALAGPSAGPNGGQLYIDGFTAGQLPPKSSIREIRINQNPFSAEYDKLGYGRIEIFTKPGSDKFHGQFQVVGNDSGLNTRNPFLGNAAQSPYYSVIYMGSLSGPISKKASFFLDTQRRDIDEIAVVDAPALGLNESVPNPRTRTNIAPRIDYQVNPNNTLTVRYQFYRDTWQNNGVGGLTLPQAGYNSNSTEDTVQITDTQTLSTKAINETRFQYLRDNSAQNPISTAPNVNVQGTFIGGGATSGTEIDHQDHYELQNYTSIAQGNHFLKFGGRLRAVHDENTSGTEFNGAYTFSSISNYTAGIPSQLTVSRSPSGVVPIVTATVVDAGLYVQDDWRVRPNLTLSGGLRFETQNDIHDHADWAPRLSFAWGLGEGKGAPKTVLRGGFGIFYNRITQDIVLNAERFNGVTEQQYTLQSTSGPVPYPSPPTTFPSSLQTLYQINPTLHAPYIIQSAFSAERQVTKTANATLTYLNSRGIHQLLNLNVNAPFPGTPFSTLTNIPNPSFGPIYQYGSDGVFWQNQLIANFNIRAGAKLSLFGYYSLNYANSDPIGSFSSGSTNAPAFTSNFPSDQYNVHADYGRASFAIRDRVFMGGTIGLPRGFRLSPFMIFSAGGPYNVTAGEDLSNDSLFNVRPAFAPNPSGVCVSPTQACHYVVPTGPYTQIPINYLTGPSQFTLNLRLAKNFGFGPETGGRSGIATGGGRGGGPHGGGGGGGGGFGRGGGGNPFNLGPESNRRYNLSFSVNARNALNRVNPGTPIGVVSSTDFGKSVGLAGGPFSSSAAVRKIELQALFSF